MRTTPTDNISNIDSQEIAKFGAGAAGWWDLKGEFKPLHRINPLRLNYILQRAGGVFAKKVLDVGCGGGILTESLAREGANVTGLDMAPEPLQIARLHAQAAEVKINYVQETVESHAQAAAQHYDIVTCMEMLEHVPHPASVIQACAEAVKPGGHVFFSTINRNAKAWLMAIVGAEYLLRMIPQGTHDIGKFIRPSELMGWVDKTPLRERHIIGLHYNPLTDRFKLGRNVDVNYMIHTQHAR